MAIATEGNGNIALECGEELLFCDWRSASFMRRWATVVGKDQRWMFRCLLYDGCIAVIKISSFNSKSFVLLKFYLTRFKSFRVFHTSYVSGLHDCITWEIRNCSRLCYHNQVLCLGKSVYGLCSWMIVWTRDKREKDQFWNLKPWACMLSYTCALDCLHPSLCEFVRLSDCLCVSN